MPPFLYVTDLERHFDLIVAKNGLATPKLVFASYKTPINGQRQFSERKENMAFSLALDELATEVVRYFRKMESLQKKAIVRPSEKEFADEKKAELVMVADKLADRGRKIWDNKE